MGDYKTIVINIKKNDTNFQYHKHMKLNKKLIG